MHIKFCPVRYLILTAIMAVILTCPLTARADSAVEWLNKGGKLGSAGRYQEAIECLDRAIDINPKYALAWYNKGVVLTRLGRYQEAINCYDRTLELNPKLVPAWNNKGLTLSKLGRNQEAISHINKSLELNSKNKYAYSNKGWILNKMGMTPIEVLECYEKALAIDPKHVPDWSKDKTPLAETPEYKQVKRAVDSR